MKQSLSFIFILLALSCIGQNWNLVNENQVLNYKTASDQFVATTVWVDSSSTLGTEQTLFLNRIVLPCDTCNNSSYLQEYLRNQAHFLGKEIHVSGDKYVVNGANEVVLFPRKSLNESWLYDTLNNITAEIILKEERMIFNVMDSVMVIQLSNLEIIEVSKTYGLLKFPDNGQGEEINLVGIDNLDLGETVPGFEEFYDFDIGDVFYYQTRYEDFQSQNFENSEYRKEIIGKQIVGDTMIYEVQITGASFVYGIYHDPSYFSYTKFETYVNDGSTFANTYHQDLLEYQTVPVWNVCQFHYDSEGVFTKTIAEGNPGYDRSSFRIDTTTELLSFTSGTMYFNEEFKVGLGKTIYDEFWFEYGTKENLIGYIKGTDTVGMVQPLYYYTSNREIYRNNSELLVYPNPSPNYLYWEWPAQKHQETQVIIYDIAGRELIRKRTIDNRIDISSLNKGMYVLTIIIDDQLVSKRIVKE